MAGQRANDLAARADGVARNPLLMRDGSYQMMPSIVRAQSAAEEAKKAATTPGATPSGSKYIGAPDQTTPSGAVGIPGAPTPTASPQPPPRQSTIDPKTAQVRTAIPPAPLAGGYPVPNIPKGAKLTEVGDDAKELAKTDSDFAKDVLPRAPVIDTGIERYRSLAQAFKMFQSGSPAEQQRSAAAMADALGFKGIAQSIMRGEVSGAQWVQKEGVNVVLDTLKAATPRFAQSEFNKLSDQGVPNITNTPQANHQLVSEGLGQLLQRKAFIDDWSQAKQNGWQSISEFYNAWSKQNPLSGFIRSAQRQIGNFKGMDLPSRDQWVEGGIYTAPNSMTPAQRDAFGKRNIQPGQMFRYSGNAISPIPSDQAFSSYLAPTDVGRQ